MVKWWDRNTNSFREKIQDAFTNQKNNSDNKVVSLREKQTQQIRGVLRKEIAASIFEKGLENTRNDLVVEKSFYIFSS